MKDCRGRVLEVGDIVVFHGGSGLLRSGVVAEFSSGSVHVEVRLQGSNEPLHLVKLPEQVCRTMEECDE